VKWINEVCEKMKGNFFNEWLSEHIKRMGGERKDNR
jgi:hypothetical protein